MSERATTPNEPDPGWLAMAIRPAVVSRAIGYALVVGTILITINHAGAILKGDVTPGRVGQMGLTVMVPYVVSTMSSVGAMRSLRREKQDRAG